MQSSQISAFSRQYSRIGRSCCFVLDRFVGLHLLCSNECRLSNISSSLSGLARRMDLTIVYVQFWALTWQRYSVSVPSIVFVWRASCQNKVDSCIQRKYLSNNLEDNQERKTEWWQWVDLGSGAQRQFAESWSKLKIARQTLHYRFKIAVKAYLHGVLVLRVAAFCVVMNNSLRWRFHKQQNREVTPHFHQ